MPVELDPVATLAVAALLVLLLVLVVGMLAVGQRRLRRDLALAEARIAALRSDLEAIGAGSLEALERVQRAEGQLRQVGGRLGLVEARSEGRSYEQAIQALKEGAGAGELVTRFGLSRGEADLLARLHGRM